MIRLKIVKPHKQYTVGQTVYVTKNEAHGLLDSGYAIYSKDISSGEIVTKKGRKHGRLA